MSQSILMVVSVFIIEHKVGTRVLVPGIFGSYCLEKLEFVLQLRLSSVVGWKKENGNVAY